MAERQMHTSEKVVLQASSRHKFIRQQPLIIFNAVTNQFNQIRMNEVAKEAYFSLPNNMGIENSQELHMTKEKAKQKKEVVNQVKCIRKEPNQPFFMTLKPIMIEGFHSNSKSRARFHWCSSVLFNPPLEYTTKTTFTKKTLWSEISRCRLEIIKCKFSKSRRNFEFLFKFGCGRIAFGITSGC